MSLGHEGNYFSFDFFFSPADLSIVNLEVSSSSWTLWDLKYAKLKRWAIPTPGLFRQENPSPIWLAQLIKNSEFRAFHTHPKINAGFIDFPVGYCHCLLIPRQFSCLLLSEFLLLIPLPEELLLCCFFGAVWASQFSPAEGQRGITQRPTCILRLSSRWDIKSNSLLSASWKCCIFLIFLECALYIYFLKYFSPLIITLTFSSKCRASTFDCLSQEQIYKKNPHPNHYSKNFFCFFYFP